MSIETLVTCHANADCDAFSAMIAARVLYSPCLLLFPGTQDGKLQEIYERQSANGGGFIDAAAVDWPSIRRLILVDTRQRGRLKHVRPLLERKDVALEIWDHHPDSDDDIEAATLHLAYTGAVTSLLTEAIRRRGLSVTAEEATLLGLGIYGDTGGFSYSSTMPEDFSAAAFLLSRGMDIPKIMECMSRDVTGSQISVLNELIESARTYLVGSQQIVITEVTLDTYMRDLATLVQRLMDIEKYDVLFAVARMQDSIQLVARSRTESVNVGAICACLGGGGHTYAASASIRRKTIAEVRDEILRVLDAQARSEKRARDYMSSPVISVNTDTRMSEADEMMLHFGLKSVPVFDAQTAVCRGLLDAQTASRATAHGLGASPVSDYMSRNVKTLSPEASLAEISSVIIQGRQRLAPVVEGEETVGVITKTDLINIFSENLPTLLTKSETKGPSIAKLMRDGLPKTLQNILEAAGETGRELGMPVYAVGGFVRDLLLRVPNHDMDLVVEGNGIALAHRLAKKLHGRVREHKKFLTSVVIFQNENGEEMRVDIATARLEYYDCPAALPSVEKASLKMDMERRDFTINALALRLDRPTDTIVDFFGGQRDIKKKAVRVLHTLSFVEDPTRCLRAVRFEMRYSFRIGPMTEKLIKNAVSLKLLDKLHDKRLFHEFFQICEEADPPACFIRLNELGILKALFADTTLTQYKIDILFRIKKFLSWYNILYLNEKAHAWVIYFYALNNDLNHVNIKRNYSRFLLTEKSCNQIMRQYESMLVLKNNIAVWYKRRDKNKKGVSEFYKLLKNAEIDSLLYLMATFKEEEIIRYISKFITDWRDERADISGEDLKEMGIPCGPIYGRILSAALYAKLDGIAPDRQSQLALARSCADVTE
ncbi:MAG: CBS domain-containing protein [Desulfovibrio sp.]|nr:CBS domain-containing protein [Desulfovibrio sp.]